MRLKVKQQLTLEPSAVPDGLPASPGSSSRDSVKELLSHSLHMQHFPFEKILSFEIRCDVMLPGEGPANGVCCVCR